VVVYCTGGDCEDSRLTAVMLSQAGVDKAKLFVYAGGITEWKAKSMPLEIGARKSGVIQNTNAAKAPDQAGFTSR
jgi:3-mercaptopyruvate sulfurtransferase SseA